MAAKPKHLVECPECGEDAFVKTDEPSGVKHTRCVECGYEDVG